MSVAALALVVVVVIIAVYVTPQWISRRQALVQSREGDRFSSDLRIVSPPEQLSQSEIESVERERLAAKSSTPLLTAIVKPAEPRGVAMIESPQPRRPVRGRQASAARLDAQQARQLAALKSKRAARLSGESSAAQRRLLTTGAALLAVVAVGIAAAFSLVAAWWLMLPGFFFIGSLIASRLAGIRSEEANVAELTLLRELQGVPVEVAEEPRAVVKASVVDDHASAEPVEVVAEVVEEDSSESVVDEVQDVAVLEEKAAVGWNVASFPPPAYALKQRVSGRQVHADTDIRGVPQVQKAPGRPIAATPLGEPAVAEEAPAASFNLDLEAILDSRRAQ